MVVKLTYFGQIAEILNRSDEEIEGDFLNIKMLDEFLKAKYPILNDVNFKYAQANEICLLQSAIKHENIALFPPFAGG